MTQAAHNTHHTTDIVIIGAGPAGLFAVFECGMLKMSCHVVDSLPETGGQCAALYPEKPVYDIPGFPVVTGAELVARLEQQAAPFAPVYHLNQQVDTITRTDAGGYHVTTSTGTTITCKAVVIAAGAGAFGPNRPPLDNIRAFEGVSVFYTVRKRQDFADKTIVIAGGGDSAVDWALSLSEIARKIYVVHRRDTFRAAPESVARMRALANVEMVIPAQLAGLTGANGHIQTVTVKDMAGATRALEADVLLPFFGIVPQLGPVHQWGVDIRQYQIPVNPATCETNRAGIFAIGDIATYPRKLRLILTGFAEAAQAAHAIYPLVFPDTELHFEYSTTKGVP